MQEVVRTPVGYKTIETGGAEGCAPQYLSQQMWDSFAWTYDTNGGLFSVSLDASACGQEEPLTATVRPSFFGGPPGTPPAVVTVAYDVANNALRVDLDPALATDGRYVLEIANASGCCALIPLEGVSL